MWSCTFWVCLIVKIKSLVFVLVFDILDLIFGHWAALSIKWLPESIYFGASKLSVNFSFIHRIDSNYFSHEYDIMNAVVRVAYKLPDDFPETIGDLIKKLVVCI